MTHAGSFDPDDVLAVAVVTMFLGEEKCEIIRSRDQVVIDQADWVVDVGGIYKKERKRFDHHQDDVPERANHVPYSSFGLVWEELGEELCGSAAVAKRIEEKLVYPIDAADNSMQVCCDCGNGIKAYELYDVINTYKPAWGRDEDFYNGFMRAVSFARKMIKRQIVTERGELAMLEYAKGVIDASENKEVVAFEKPVIRHVLAELPDIKGFVSPVFDPTSSDWMAVTVPVNSRSFTNRMSFPEEWRGKSLEELHEVTGLSGVTFCHKELYFVVASSKEAALQAIAAAK